MIQNFGESPIHSLQEYRKNQIYVKREDLLPFSLGGNKVRIAREFFLDMEEKKCDTMIAYGNSKSNLCRVIANECRARNIPCYIINSIGENEKLPENTCNSQMVKLFGSKLIPCKKDKIAETVERTVKNIENLGGRPYYIFGDKFGTGNEGIAAGAYAKAYGEIALFEKIKGLRFDYIFHASGSGATQSGMVCGHLIAKDSAKVIGISISSRNYERAVGIIKIGIESYMKRINMEYIPEYDQEIFLETEYRKGGYGCYDGVILDCIKSVLMEEGLPLDPVYTGKAFWGMREYLKKYNIHGKNILFLHTGGTPLFYDCLTEGKII